jgi:hypothetical protein
LRCLAVRKAWTRESRVGDMLVQAEVLAFANRFHIRSPAQMWYNMHNVVYTTIFQSTVNRVYV